MIQVYTGDGKGKTTAAVGQGIRCAGRGLNVCMIQFLKNCDTGEMHCVECLENFKIFRFGQVKGFFKTLTDQQKDQLRKDTATAFEFACESVFDYDVVILDEIMSAINYGLLKVPQVVTFLDAMPPDVEIILTGRCAPEDIINKAHYVSEIVEIKHPYKQGVNAREGIEF